MMKVLYIAYMPLGCTVGRQGDVVLCFEHCSAINVDATLTHKPVKCCRLCKPWFEKTNNNFMLIWLPQILQVSLEHL